MVKLSKRKGANSDATLKRKQNPLAPKKINPFEVHQNKEKFKILGRKNKHDHGLPGISRGKAVKKRKETLGKEFETRNKTNKFTDRRIYGNLTNDEVASLRFAALQQNKFNKANKKDLFNLNDEEVLTHRGQTLEEIEQFKNEGSEESDADEALNAKFTEVAHFGGGDGVTVNDRKSAIEDMILEAKKRKAEVLKDKEEVLEMTTKLDENYKLLLPQLGKLNSNFSKPNKVKIDDYDKVMREMIFEPRGEVADKLKTQEEIDKKEKVRLEKLEKERLARMKGEEVEKDIPKHISADDLDDGYFVESDDENDENKILSYDINGDSNLGKKDNINTEIEDENEMDEESDEQNDSEDDESAEDEEDDLMDLKYSESSDEENAEVQTNERDIKSNTKKKIKTAEFHENEIEKVRHITEIPADQKEFTTLFLGKSPETQHYLFKKLLQCNHPKLDGQNRQKITKLFNHALQYLNDVFNENCEIEKSFKVLNQIMPHFFDMVQISPEDTAKKFLETIKVKYEKYKTNIKKVPGIDTIIIFKLISNLYSTSDFRHPIVTPSVIFISQILSRCNFKSRRDISLGLFLVTILLEFTNFSKRFLPAGLQYLLGIILLAVPKKPIQVVKIIPPFESIAAANGNDILFLKEKLDIENVDIKLSSRELVTNDSIDDKFRIMLLNTTLELIKEFAELLTNNVGGRYIAAEFIKLMGQMNLKNYPEVVMQNYNNAKKNLDATSQSKLLKLVAPVRKPKALRLFEPRFEKVVDDKRRRKMSEEKTMRAKLIHKIKRETKGAEREIRRDTQFLNKIKIKQQIQSDVERKEKVKKIFAEASVQQGELNALQRQRNKTKF